MSWAGLGSSDFVSGNNLQDAVNNSIFTLKAGQSIPANNTFLTKSEIEARVNVTISTGSSSDFPTKASVSSSGPPLISSTAYYHASNRWLATIEETLCGTHYTVYCVQTADTILTGDTLYTNSGGTTPVANGYWALWSPYYDSWVTVQTSSGVVTNMWIANPTLLYREAYGVDSNLSIWPRRYDVKHFPYKDNPDNNLGYSSVFTVQELGGWANGSQVYIEYDGCYGLFTPYDYAYFSAWDGEEDMIIITNQYGQIIGVNYYVSIYSISVISWINSDAYEYDDFGTIRWSMDFDYTIQYQMTGPLSSSIEISGEIYQYFNNFAFYDSQGCMATIPAGSSTTTSSQSTTFNLQNSSDSPDEPYAELRGVTYTGWELVMIET